MWLKNLPLHLFPPIIRCCTFKKSIYFSDIKTIGKLHEVDNTLIKKNYLKYPVTGKSMHEISIIQL